MAQLHKVIIDTDPGVDDAMALLLALASPEIKIEGFTIVMGNNPDVGVMATNCQRIVAISGVKFPTHINIYKGATQPLKGTLQNDGAFLCHGDNGLGDLTPEIAKQFEFTQQQLDDHIKVHQSKNAIDFIIDTCKAHTGQIILITLGPLTNIALALNKDPQLSQHIKKIVCMGGCFRRQGNVSPVSEANIFNDPNAARVVFKSGVPIELTPLDVTHRVFTDTPLRESLNSVGKAGRFIYEITKKYVIANVGWGTPLDECPTHDPCAIMAVIKPQVFTKCDEAYVDVEVQGEITLGSTVADYDGVLGKKKQTKIYMEADQDAFKEFYLERIKSLPGNKQ